MPARRLEFLPWMDGLRGVAVLAVLAYHERLIIPGIALGRWDYSGDLGVDMFFAISGFLITSLLLQDAPRIRFAAFYGRRARRLLPALFTLLAVMTVAALVVDRGHARTSTLEHVGIGLGYAANWVQALSNHNLFDLAHLWSLAAEEQFYLVWPLVLAGLLIVSRRRPRALLAAVAVFAVGSVAYPQFGVARGWGFPRFYYGLDTRCSGLAFGALLGVAYTTGALPDAARKVRGALALVGAVVLLVLLHDARILNHLSQHLGIAIAHLASEQFALAAAATTCIVWELLASPTHLGHRVLAWGPLQTVGRISYGLYLYNGPIVTVLTPKFTGISNDWALAALHVGLTFAAAAASWVLIETRFRRPSVARPRANAAATAPRP